MPGNLGSNFYPKLVEISSELGMKPEDLLAVMVSESGIDPSAHEHQFNGGGIIGFMPQTLKNLNFKGTPEDFRKLSGEEQLDYVKKLISSNQNNQQLTSPAQYYINNFVPAALKLPGIKTKQMSYAFLEEHPDTIRDPKTGILLSKKYHDVGISLPAKDEAIFYKKNPLFHGSTPGAITYGDMVAQVNKNKQSSTYKKAISDMFKTTGYRPQSVKNHSAVGGSIMGDFMKKLKHLLHQFSLASRDENDFLIVLGSSSDTAATVQYAEILSTAIAEYLKTQPTIHGDSNNIEMVCQASGSKKEGYEQLRQLSAAISSAFASSSKNIQTFALVIPDAQSEFPPLHPRQMDLYDRKFKMAVSR